MSNNSVIPNDLTLTSQELQELFFAGGSDFNYQAYLTLRSEMGQNHDNAWEFAINFDLEDMDEGILRRALVKHGVTVADVVAAAEQFKEHQKEPEPGERSVFLTFYLGARSRKQNHEEALHEAMH